MLIEELDDEEEEEDPEDATCPVCQDDDNEEVLMACDSCDTYHHTYCVGLDSVPIGHWFCENCETTRAIESVCPNDSTHPVSSRGHRTPSRRTRGQMRRLRNRNQATSSNWARVWQSVWDNLNLDLDFPFDENSGAPRYFQDRAAATQQREFREWERRLAVAERQGAARSFRDTASALLDLGVRRERPEMPDPESREEIRAWNAFEKAKEIDADPTPKRKRKSATTSPSDADAVTEPERPLKRPRTRRNPEPIDTSSSASRRSSAAGPSSSRQVNGSASGGPTFLQSMLREIETSSTPDENKTQIRLPHHIATNHSSPQPPSPGASPTSSNHASPRPGSITPPPTLATRPGSPLSLTSVVEPNYPPVPTHDQFSPSRCPPPPDGSPATTSGHSGHHRRHGRQLSQQRQSRSLHRSPDRPLASSSPVRPVNGTSRSADSSPTRAGTAGANMPLSTKSDLQKMVSSALKPYYQSQAVSKDEYTDINRNVSRMLYEMLGERGNGYNLEEDSKVREGFEKMASDEVAKAVKSLKGLNGTASHMTAAAAAPTTMAS